MSKLIVIQKEESECLTFGNVREHQLFVRRGCLCGKIFCDLDDNDEDDDECYEGNTIQITNKSGDFKFGRIDVNNKEIVDKILTGVKGLKVEG
ncbi:MAG: hypothetical protein ACTSSK_03565 [Candidatus Heimdallarchaeota archaeon]